jgi:hypothetical protein
MRAYERIDDVDRPRIITNLSEAVPDRDLAGPQSLVLSSRRIRAVRKLTNTGFRYGTASTPSPILRAVDKRSG